MGTIGTLEQILHGPSTVADGSMNLMGALRRTMATSGYSELKEFQRVEVSVTPASAPTGWRRSGRCDRRCREILTSPARAAVVAAGL